MFSRFVVFGFLIFASTGFAIKPEDMEPNRWYETVQVAPMLIDITCIPDSVGLIFGVGYFYTSSYIKQWYLFKSTNSGETWERIDPFPFALSSNSHLTISHVQGHDRVYVDDARKIACSDDKGETWNVLPELDPDLVMLGISPHGSTMIRATRVDDSSPMAIDRSTDGGLTWSERYVISYTSGTIKSINFSTMDPDRILIGCSYEELAILKSDDGGATWIPLVNSEQWGGWNKGVNRIVFHPQDADCLISLGDWQESYMRKSTDSGVTWSQFGSGSGALDISIDPENPEIMIVAAGGCPAIERTSDSGNTWEPVVTVIYCAEQRSRHIFEVSPWQPGMLYIPYDQIHYTPDFGLKWFSMNYVGLGHMGYISRNHRGLMIRKDYTQGRWRSLDWGLTWESLPRFPIDRKLYFSQFFELRSNDALFAFASDYGQCNREFRGVIYKSTDLGLTWQELSNDVSDEISEVFPSKSLSHRVFGIINNREDSYEDFKSWAAVSNDEGISWQAIPIEGTDDVKCVSDDPRNPCIWYVLGRAIENANALLFRTTDDGQSWEEIGRSRGMIDTVNLMGIQGNVLFDPHDRNVLYAQPRKVYISEDKGQSWNLLTQKATRFFDGFIISEVNSLEFLFQTTDDNKSRSVDRGKTFGDAVFPLETQFVPGFPDVIYDLASMSMLKIDSRPPQMQLGGYGNTRLQAGQSSSLVVAGVAQDTDLHDKVMRIDLLIEDTPIGVSLRDDVLPDSGFYFTQSETTPGQSGMWLLNFQAVDYFGNSDSRFPLLHTRP